VRCTYAQHLPLLAEIGMNLLEMSQATAGLDDANAFEVETGDIPEVQVSRNVRPPHKTDPTPSTSSPTTMLSSQICTPQSKNRPVRYFSIPPAT
jgi:hypothetical protein